MCDFQTVLVYQRRKGKHQWSWALWCWVFDLHAAVKQLVVTSKVDDCFCWAPKNFPLKLVISCNFLRLTPEKGDYSWNHDILVPCYFWNKVESHCNYVYPLPAGHRNWASIGSHFLGHPRGVIGTGSTNQSSWHERCWACTKDVPCKYLSEPVDAGLNLNHTLFVPFLTKNVSDVLLTPYLHLHLSAMFVCILTLVLPPASPIPSVLIKFRRLRGVAECLTGVLMGIGDAMVWAMKLFFEVYGWLSCWFILQLLELDWFDRCAIGASREMRYQRYQWFCLNWFISFEFVSMFWNLCERLIAFEL